MKKIIFSLLILVSGIAYGQGGYVKPNNSYGTISNRASIDSTLFFPTGCGAPSLRGYNLRKSAQYFDSCAAQFWIYNPSTSLWDTLHVGAAASSGWGLTGNAGTTAGTNFIGTTDNVGLLFKTNNVQSGYIDLITGSTSFGYQSLLNNSNTNTAFGNQALKANTSGNGNLALGSSSLASNTIGGDNVAIGEGSIPVNINGSNNIGIGHQALNSNVDGSRNTGIGEDAVSNNVSGTDNIGIGYESLINTTGSGNIGLGSNSGSYNTTQSNRVYINSLSRGGILGDTTESIIYGYQDATAANQRLYLNSQVHFPYATAQANAADSMMVILPSTGKVGYRAIPTSSGGTVTGTGTAGQLTKWTGTSSIGDATTGTGVLTALGVNVGSTGAFQRNNDGFNGTVGATTPSTGAFTTGSFSGQVTNTTNGAASTPPSRLTGTWFTGGSATTTKPQLLIEPTGTTSTAWSTSGTGLGINAASGFTGNLIDLQLNGTAKIYGRYDGYLRAQSIESSTYFQAGPSSYFQFQGRGYFTAPSVSSFAFFAGSGDLQMMVGGTTSSFPSLVRNGTGIDVKLANNSAYTNISALTTRTTAVAFASLPTGVTGMIATINNSTTNTWGATIAGGGANTVLGFFNGTNWTVIGQ